MLYFLTDISLQAASQILSVPVHSALKVMKDIAQNFPVKARYVHCVCFWYIHEYLDFVNV